MPVGDTVGDIGAYIIALREFGRTVSARFEALRVWAVAPKETR